MVPVRLSKIQTALYCLHCFYPLWLCVFACFVHKDTEDKRATCSTDSARLSVYTLLTMRRPKDLNNVQHCSACTVHERKRKSVTHPTTLFHGRSMNKDVKVSSAKKETNHTQLLQFQSLCSTHAMCCRVVVVALAEWGFHGLGERMLPGVICKVGVKCPFMPLLRMFSVE